MAKTINLEGVVFERNQYKNTINTNFTELGAITPITLTQQGYTVYDFFNDYQRLYGDIPDEGEFNSKSYLTQRSGEYVYDEAITQTINELTLELLELLTELVNKQQELVETQINSVLQDSTITLNPI
jgi:hypothetical protein